MAWRAFLTWFVTLVVLLLALTSVGLRLVLPKFPALTDAILDQIHVNAGLQVDAEQLQISWLGRMGIVQAQDLIISRDGLQVAVGSARLYMDLLRSLREQAPRFNHIELGQVEVTLGPSSGTALRVDQVTGLLAAPLAMADDVRLTDLSIRAPAWSVEGFNGQLLQSASGPTLDFSSQLRLSQAGVGLRGQVSLLGQDVRGYVRYQAQGEYQSEAWDSRGETWLRFEQGVASLDWRGELHSLGDRLSALGQFRQMGEGWQVQLNRVSGEVSGQSISLDELRVKNHPTWQAELLGAKLQGLPTRVLPYLSDDLAERLQAIAPSLNITQAWHHDGLTYALLGAGASSAHENIPGGQFGQARLAMRGAMGVVEVREITQFASNPVALEPLAFDRGAGWVAWDRLAPRRWRLAGQGLELHRSDFDALGGFRLQLSPDPQQRRFSLLIRGNSQGQPAQDLVPMHSVGEGLRNWWQQAQPRAVLDDGLFWWNDGVERHRVLDLDAQQVSVTPAQDWPQAQAQQGRLSWDGESFDILAMQAQMAGLQAPQVQVKKRAQQPWRLSSQVQAPAQGYREVLAQLPLTLGDWPQNLNLSGTLSGSIDLALESPLAGQVRLTSQDLDAQWLPLNLAAQQLAGQLIWDLDKGFVDSQFQGQYAGRPVQVSFDDGPTFGLAVQAQIEAKDASARFLPQLEPYVSGVLSVQAKVADEWQVTTALTQSNTQLPLPMNQAGQLTITGNDERIQVRFEDHLDLRLAGDQLAGNLDAADLVGWAEVLSANSGEGDSIQAQLRIRDTRLDQVKIGASQLDFADSMLQIEGPNVMARVSFDEVIDARIERLIGQGPPESDEPQEPVYQPAPTEFPAINLNAENIVIDDQKIDRLNTQVRNSSEGLRFDPLVLSLGGADVQAQAFWSNQTPQSSLTAQVSFADLGELLASQGLGRPVETRQGTLQADLRWAGYPWSPQFKNASGDLVLETQAGRFLEGNNSTEALRLLGVFNLATVTRRLRLDFSDLIQPGLAFDQLTGTARIRAGRLSMVEPLILDGPSAKMFLTGTSDLPTSTLDHRLRVQVPLSAQLPAAALLAGFPALAAGVVLLFDQVAGDTLSRIGETNYSVTGTFEQPLIEPIKPEATQ